MATHINGPAIPNRIEEWNTRRMALIIVLSTFMEKNRRNISKMCSAHLSVRFLNIDRVRHKWRWLFYCDGRIICCRSHLSSVSNVDAMSTKRVLIWPFHENKHNRNETNGTNHMKRTSLNAKQIQVNGQSFESIHFYRYFKACACNR